MSKSKTPPALKPIDVVDWTGVRLQRLEYEPAGTIFAQGDAAPSVMYVETGAVRLSVLSHAGKEAVVALLEVGHFFGEGCLAGQMQRMVRHLHASPTFADSRRRGSTSPIARRRSHMLYTIAGIYTVGSFIHVLLVVAIVLFLVGLLRGRRVLG
jgi:cyclic nucleotide-binding protein